MTRMCWTDELQRGMVETMTTTPVVLTRGQEPSTKTQWMLLTAIAPILFGSNYWVIQHFLPADSPLWGSALRALPAGIVLLIVVRRLPRGAWWWKSAVLGSLNMGVFFLLIYVAAQLLPSSVAASIGSLGPIVLALLAWALVGERPTARLFLGAIMGIIGVLLIVGMATERLNPLGIAASLGALVLMSLGAVLTKRWDDGTPVLVTTSWQLIAGGLELLLVAVVVEGAPPALDMPGYLALAYVSLIATALAYFFWFSGFRHLPAGTVGIIGLLNPVTGVVLGTLLASEVLTLPQIGGIALVLLSIVVGKKSANKKNQAVPKVGASDKARDAVPQDPVPTQ